MGEEDGTRWYEERKGNEERTHSRDDEVSQSLGALTRLRSFSLCRTPSWPWLVSGVYRTPGKPMFRSGDVILFLKYSLAFCSGSAPALAESSAGDGGGGGCLLLLLLLRLPVRRSRPPIARAARRAASAGAISCAGAEARACRRQPRERCVRRALACTESSSLSEPQGAAPTYWTGHVEEGVIQKWVHYHRCVPPSCSSAQRTGIVNELLLGQSDGLKISNI
ncbi:hypothetical protein V5799_029966 [Amblyomma americanum]|uniref:Uncharacterized protein n=1 Tax=Amblyomma americanum TaxID=6943 RepID=A0AAQ4EPL9_AMBAM